MDTGIGELHTKRVAKQIAAAIDFIHSKQENWYWNLERFFKGFFYSRELVHRDIKLDNVL